MLSLFNFVAFVEFESPRDAEDAVRGLDGRTICGRRARVEVSSGKSGRGFRGGPSRSGGGGGAGGGGGGGGRGRHNSGKLHWLSGRETSDTFK